MTNQNHTTELDVSIQQKLNQRLIYVGISIIDDYSRTLQLAINKGDEVTINSISESFKNIENLTGLMLEAIDDI